MNVIGDERHYGGQSQYEQQNYPIESMQCVMTKQKFIKQIKCRQTQCGFYYIYE